MNTTMLNDLMAGWGHPQKLICDLECSLKGNFEVEHFLGLVKRCSDNSRRFRLAYHQRKFHDQSHELSSKCVCPVLAFIELFALSQNITFHHFFELIDIEFIIILGSASPNDSSLLRVQEVRAITAAAASLWVDWPAFFFLCSLLSLDQSPWILFRLKHLFLPL